MVRVIIQKEGADVYGILHFLSGICFDKVVWAPASAFLPSSEQISIWSIQETMWKSVLTSQTDKMRHRTAKHMAQIEIHIWPTQTIFPEIHTWKTPPAAKARKQRVDMTKRAVCAREMVLF